MTLHAYQKRVSFDNVTNIPPAFHSFTLKQSSQGFVRTKRTRTFMIAIDLYESTLDSLSFTLKSLIDDGDEVVVVGVYSPMINYSHINTSDNSLLDLESMILPPRDKAQQIMNWIVNSHQGDNINIIVELTFGRTEVALKEMIKMYQPSMMIVGSRNKLKQKHAYSGAGTFKYSLKHCHLPIVVVRDKGIGSTSASTGCLICYEEPIQKKQQKKSFSLFNCTYYYHSD